MVVSLRPIPACVEQETLDPGGLSPDAPMNVCLFQSRCSSPLGQSMMGGTSATVTGVVGALPLPFAVEPRAPAKWRSKRA